MTESNRVGYYPCTCCAGTGVVKVFKEPHPCGKCKGTGSQSERPEETVTHSIPLELTGAHLYALGQVLRNLKPADLVPVAGGDVSMAWVAHDGLMELYEAIDEVMVSLGTD